jgi:hypothetical protein
MTVAKTANLVSLKLFGRATSVPTWARQNPSPGDGCKKPPRPTTPAFTGAIPGPETTRRFLTNGVVGSQGAIALLRRSAEPLALSSKVRGGAGQLAQ